MRGRKSRSDHLIRAKNVEHSDRNVNSADLISFTPKVLELIDLFVSGFSTSNSGRAIALIGPYGSGKSTSLLTLCQLCSGKSTRWERELWSALAKASSATARNLSKALQRSGGLVVVAINVSDLPLDEALHLKLNEADRVIHKSKRQSQSRRRLPLRDRVLEFLKERNLLLVIDEVGRALERAALSGSSAELQLLQDLAELSQRVGRHSLHLITAQHFATTDYRGVGSKTLASELAKVQGRFLEFPFMDTGDSSLELLAKELSKIPGKLEAPKVTLTTEVSDLLKLSRSKSTLIRRCMPLDPIAVLALLELSSRYAQSTRTLMTFVKGDEKYALKHLLNFDSSGRKRRTIHAYEIFDFFVASQATAVTAADFDLRWREISTLIRDHAHLPEEQLITLKTISVLNLASNASLSASPVLVKAALPEVIRKHFASSISKLMSSGLIAWRESGNEYRAWRGTVFPIEQELDNAKGKLSQISTSSLLRSVSIPRIIFSRKHTVKTGIDRFFVQTWTDEDGGHFEDFRAFKPSPDGLIAFRFDATERTGKPDPSCSKIPFIEVTLRENPLIRRSVIELRALNDVLHQIPEADQVARAEIRERIVALSVRVESQIASLTVSGLSTAIFEYQTQHIPVRGARSLSAVVSFAVEHVYPAAPIVRNEMVSSRQLSSQGAKAVRLLIEAMYREPDSPRFGIAGNPPEGAIYDSVFALTGLGRSSSSMRKDRVVAESWQPLLKELKRLIRSQTASRRSFSELVDIATSPPFGLRRPLANLVLNTLVYDMRSEISLYEHGTLVIDLNDAVAERLLKNPDLFLFRASSVNLKENRQLVDAYREVLRITDRGSTAMDLASALISRVIALPNFTLNTLSYLDERTARFRKVLRNATDPETLLFEQLPLVLIDDRNPRLVADFNLKELKRNLKAVLDDLSTCYERLLASFDRWILAELRLPDSTDHPSRLAKGMALSVHNFLMQPQQRALVEALLREDLSSVEWTQNLAMVVSQAGSPRNWQDDQVTAFQSSLQEQMASFRRLLSLSIQSGNRGSEQHRFALVSLISTDGVNLEQVLHLTSEDDARIAKARKDLVEEIRNLELDETTVRGLLLGLLFDDPLEADVGVIASLRSDHRKSLESRSDKKRG